MAVAAYEQTPRSFVDPHNDFPSPDQVEFVAHVAVILALLAYFLG